MLFKNSMQIKYQVFNIYIYKNIESCLPKIINKSTIELDHMTQVYKYKYE